ncbi:MAG: SDR family oxidoreductase [Desulfosalsimonadaceae bacterium]
MAWVGATLGGFGGSSWRSGAGILDCLSPAIGGTSFQDAAERAIEMPQALTVAKAHATPHPDSPLSFIFMDFLQEAQLSAKYDFSGKVAVITGGASGIGLAVARRLARAGAVLALLDMDKASLAACEGEFKRNNDEIMVQTCDVSVRQECETAIQAVIERFGGIDVLFNNAGITQRSRFVDTRPEVFEKVMAVNFFGALYCTKAAIDSIVLRKGMIIVNESIAGITPLVGRTGYSASKHAMHGLFSSLSAELGGKGVHVMIVCPGFIETNLQKRALGADGTVTDRPQSFVGRQDTPESAAEKIYRAARRKKRLLVLTFMGKLGVFVHKLAPAYYEKKMVKLFSEEL